MVDSIPYSEYLARAKSNHERLACEAKKTAEEREREEAEKKARIRSVADELLTKLKSLSDDERHAVFDAINDTYCRHCNDEHGTYGYCVCWNDE